LRVFFSPGDRIATLNTGRPPARCPWCRSFSGGLRSEPDGHLSMHPALQ
jgi:hypothetical protein